jgi:hypothetical protein
MVVVVVILVAWVVILGPSVLRRRARAGSHQSIVHFHHQLRILEHSAPEPIVAPAYRLRSVGGAEAPHGISYPGSGERPVLTVVGAKDLPRPALAFLGEPAPVDGDGVAGRPAPGAVARGFDAWESYEMTPHYRAPAAAPYDYADPDGAAALGGHGADPLAGVDPRHPGVYRPTPGEELRAHEAAVRRQTRRRRRDALLVLSGATLFTFLAACASGSGAIWFLTALAVAALGGYVVLLVQLQRRAYEREDKLHYIDAHRGDAHGVGSWDAPGYGPPTAPPAYGPSRHLGRPGADHPASGRTAAR